MRCNNDEALSETQLSAAIDGQADEQVLNHIATCPFCAARLAQARTTETVLRTRIYRFDCPSSQELADYHLGMVNSVTDKRLTRHLALCPACQSEIETLRTFLLKDHPHSHIAAPSASPSSTASALTDLIASILPRSPQFALRGNNLSALSAKAGDTTLMLIPERDSKNQITLAGQILDEAIDQWIGAKVEVYQNSQIIKNSVIDELGGFAAYAIPQDIISLRIVPARGQAIMVPAIEL